MTARKTIKKECNLARTRNIRVYPTKDHALNSKNGFALLKDLTMLVLPFIMIYSKYRDKTTALHQDACIMKNPKTTQVLKDKEDNPKMFGDSYGEKEAARLKESTDAPDWVFEVPQLVRDSEINNFFKALYVGGAKN